MLVCLCWFDFGLLLLRFCAMLFYKCSVADSLMSDMLCGEWIQVQSAWECVYACMSVAICAVGVELWCMCWTVMHSNTWISWLCLCLIGCVLSHLNVYVCIAREMPLMIVNILWRCRTSRLTWNIFGCENILNFYFFFIPMHKSCDCVELVASYRIWMCILLHCSWNAAHDCDDMVTMSDMEIGVKHEIYLDAKISWNFIQTVFRFIFCSCWPSPPFFTGSWDNTVRIWEVASQEQVAELKGHTSAVWSVAFDSSGKYLASGERRGA